MTKIFKVPFATQGDKTVVPVETQPDGSVSYTQGYSYDYERDQASDPSAKDIEREKMNSLFHDITESIGEMQLQGFAKWSEAGKPYPIRSVVYHKNKAWQSKVENNNIEPVAGNAWAEFKADATASDVGAYSKGESDKRFQPLGNYTPSGYSYSKEETDNKYQPKGNYAPAGNYSNKGDSYTKTESDGRYQGKGNYQQDGYSYSKLEADNKYQQKGNYASSDNFSVHTGSSAVRSPNKLYTLEIQNDGQMVVGDTTGGTPKAVIRFTKDGELSIGSVPANKISGLSKGVGGSESAIMSQKASTDSFQPKGDYATTQSLADGLRQKFDKTGGYVTGFILSEGEMSVKTDSVHIALITSDAVRGAHIAVRENANEGYGRFSFPSKSGTFLASGDISQTTGTSTTSVMSQKASTDAFQIKGDYATKSEMNVELNKKVDKANISQQLANDVNKVPSLDLLAKELGRKQASGDYALRGESYTKSESDAKYQPKGNYGAKNTANKALSGWWKCGDTGVIYQWGDAKGCITADQTRNFPIAFPNACVQIVACYANFDDYGMGVAAMPINSSSFVVTARNHAGYAGDGVVRYIAVGY